MSERIIGVLHGPNLNMLGTREPERYGRVGLAEINRRLTEIAAAAGYSLAVVQSNHEGELVDWLQETAPSCRGLLLNPAALTHTSVALRDALLMLTIPSVEVHLTNPHAREPFRHQSLICDVVTAGIRGFGAHSYSLALQGLLALLEGNDS